MTAIEAPQSLEATARSVADRLAVDTYGEESRDSARFIMLRQQIEKYLLEFVAVAEEETIERCAKIAEQRFAYESVVVVHRGAAEDIARDIRKLKGGKMSSRFQELDAVTIDWYLSQMNHFTEDGWVNLCDVIAASRGWKPLEVGEDMTVHYGGKRYKITREE